MSYPLLIRTSFFFLLTCILHSAALAQMGSCEQAQAGANLDVGNVIARIYNDGALFWKGGNPVYEVPKGDSVHAVFASTFVIGGMMDGELRMAASQYGPYEFWPGPLDEEGNPPGDCSEYDQIWELRSEDFEQVELENTFSENMINWPWELGAPVLDGDGNPGNYNLEGGDRPELLGDQMLWWVMNDRGNEHVWSETQPIGLEVHGSAYAFNAQGPLGDMTFYRYRVINKNAHPLSDTFVGIIVDSDLGNASDDYVGTDSLSHLAYTYNADPVDEGGYEDLPPAIGTAFLITPEATVDNYDNDRDGEIDEPGEPIGAYTAGFFDSGGGVQGDPSDGVEMYNYIRGRWPNGQLFTEGGTGLDFSNVPTRFVLSGDPFTRSYWSELQPSPNNDLSPNPGADRRHFISSGPMTLVPADTSEFLVAFVWAQGEDYLDSVRKLEGIVLGMQTEPRSFLVSGYRSGQVISGPPDPQDVLGFDQNFPNPFSRVTTLRYSLPKSMQVRLTVYDILGRQVEQLFEGGQEAGIYSLDFNGSALPVGIYYARIQMDHLQFIKKMVKVP